MYFKRVVSANLSQEYCDKMNEIYPEVMGHTNPLTFREFLERLIDIATMSKENHDAEEIAYLKKDYVRIYKELTETNEQSGQYLETIKSLQLQLSETPNPAEGQYIVNLDEIQEYIINEMAVLETRRTGKQVTPQMILAHLFKHQVYYGPGDWLPRIYTIAELKAIQRKIEMQKSLNEVETLNDNNNE